MENQEKQTFFVKYLWLICIAIFFFIRFPFFISNAFVPDEIWHTNVMQSMKGLSYLHVDNFQGQGSAFWYFGARLMHIFGDVSGMYILRIISCLSLAATAFFVILPFKMAFEKHWQTTILFTVFVLTLPLFWWGGKLIMPEFFQCFLIGLAYYFIYIKKKYSMTAFFLLGFCFGLKIDAGAAISFFIIDNLLQNFKENKLLFLKTMLVFVLGFIICDPLVILNLKAFLRDYADNGHYLQFSSWQAMWDHWLFILTGEYSEWDLVYFGGLDKTSLPLINLALIIAMLYIACRDKKIRITPLIIFLLSIIVSLSINERFLSHYLFTMVIVALLLASKATNFKIKYLDIFLFIAILINMTVTMPNIVKTNQQNQELADNLQNATEHTQCILSLVQDQKNIGIIVNNTDMGADARHQTFLRKEMLLKQLHLATDFPLASYVTMDNITVLANPKIVASFMNGKINMLYLDGKRLRESDYSKYPEFIPDLENSLAKMGKADNLHIHFLGDCFGTRVNILSIRKGE